MSIRVRMSFGDIVKPASHFPNAVIDSRRRRRVAGAEGQDRAGSSQDGATGASLFEEKARKGKGKGKGSAGARPGKLTAAQLRELEAQKEREAAQSYARVRDLWPRMLAGDEDADREWMYEAEMLIESFRETRALFLTTRVCISALVCGTRADEFRSTSGTAVCSQNLAGRNKIRRRTKRTWRPGFSSILVSHTLIRKALGNANSCLEGRETAVKKSKAENGQELDSFRTILFDDWLRLFMQVSRFPWVMTLC